MKLHKKLNFVLFVLTIILLLLILFFYLLIINRDVFVEDIYVKEFKLRRDNFSKDYLKQADNLLNNKIIIPSKKDYYWTYRGNMNEFKNKNRSDQRYLYAFFMLNDLVNAYEQTSDTKYLDKGFYYLKDFFNQCPYKFDPVNNMPWHDEASAQRLMNSVRFYKASKHHLGDEDLKLIRKNLEFTAKKLSSEMYSGFNNHGMFQDLSLYIYGKAFNKNDFVKLSSQRLEKYFLGSFSKEGVHLENSPEYHFEMLYMLKDFLNIAQREDFAKYDELKQVYDNSLKYSVAISLPNNFLPNIGDTAKLKYDLNDFYYSEDIKKFSNDIRFKFLNSGYDIYKNKKNYLVFIGPSYLYYHHHNHDLSFWLYKNGNIFTESGKYGYDWSDPITRSIRDYPAHNSVVVDNENSISPDLNDGQMYDLGKNKMAASSNRSSYAKIYREISYNDDFTDIKIETKLIPKDDKNHKYELFFHLDPAISVKYSKDNPKKLILYRNGNKIGYIISSEKFSLKDDFYYEKSYAEGKKTKVIYINTVGKEKNIIMDIKLK
ncbi:MAG: heparinase II/III family protein [Lagierella massiliensis]|nr:heparinase II/III family protein [Lagierella massiliensis]